jgi:coproporphyrinogen III oxidase-like Fe-S oxidoreductase
MPEYQVNAIPPPGAATVARWSADQVVAEWRRLDQDLQCGAVAGHYANLYLHVPYCRSKCTYCMYDSRTLRDEDAARSYVELVEAELERFAPATEGLLFQNLHVGGGTPTILDEPSLRRMLGAVFRTVRLAEDGSKVIETNPDNVTAAKAELLVERGFNKISIGVQSMDPAVLERHGRGHQSHEQVSFALAHLRESGDCYVNCDFMVGLAGDRAETFLRGLGELLELGPDTVMLTKLQPQWGYLRRHFDGSYDRFVAHFDAEFAPAIESMLALVERAGYQVDNPLANELGWRLWKRGFSPPYDERRPYYCTGGELPTSTLGIGRFARSRIFGRLVYQHDAADRAGDPAASPYRGYPVTRQCEAARWTISQIAARRMLDRRQFRFLFGEPPEHFFPGLIEALVATGDAEIDGEMLRFAPADTREMFVLTRLFLDRRTLLRELSPADHAAVVVDVGAIRLRFCVEAIQRNEDACSARAGRLGLRIDVSEPPVCPQATAVVGLLLRLFRRAAKRRPWQSAIEVAEWMCRSGQKLLADMGDVTIALDVESDEGAKKG